MYGFNTGVGKLKDFNIGIQDNELFQNNIVMTHCGGRGRGLLPKRWSGQPCWSGSTPFARGHRALRMEVIDRLLEMLNKGVHPIIPDQGSVGACGDLAPLAHMASVLIGYKDAEAILPGQAVFCPPGPGKGPDHPHPVSIAGKGLFWP